MVLGIECLLLDNCGVLLEALWHVKVPDSFTKLILDVCVIMATVGASSMDDHTLQLILAVLWGLKGLRVQVGAHVKFERELEPVVDFYSLERIVVKIEAVQINSQDWR